MGVYLNNGGYEFVPFAYTGYKFNEFVHRVRSGLHYFINHISGAPTVKFVHFLPTSPVFIFAVVAMPRTTQSPSLQRSPRHDKSKETPQ